MNASDEERDPQRPITPPEGSETLDGKIAARPKSWDTSVAAAAAARRGSPQVQSQEERAVIRRSDVLCGRSKESFNHAGNKDFRNIIANSVENYLNAQSRHDKTRLVHSIVEHIRKAGGRFLKMESGRWVPLDERAAKDKVSHAIRDAANARRQENRQQQRSASLPPAAAPDDEMKTGATSDYNMPSPLHAHIPHAAFPGPESFHHSWPFVSMPTANLPPPSAQHFRVPQRPESAPPGTGEPDHDQQFLQDIDEVLGPMRHDTDDPLAELLDLE